ncbi:MAG: hypothetical protein RLO12_16375 [Fulvivirga sp.]
MKKILLLIGLVAGISVGVNAQHFTTSFGFELGWGIPNRVQTIISHDYYGYDMVHAARVARVGVDYFDVVLQRGDVFIQVTVRNDGFISRRTVYQDYPLYNHVCSHSCGYHNNYYTTYRNVCTSHHHHGHNHVTYVKNKHYYNGPGHHGKGYAYGHNKTGKNHDKYNKSQWSDQGDSYSRRDRYHDESRRSNSTRGQRERKEDIRPSRTKNVSSRASSSTR